MGLDVYFREDVRQGIVAVAAAMLSTAVAHGVSNVEYCRGVLDTSRAQALNYGMSWSDIQLDLQGVLAETGRRELLDLLARAIPSGV